MLETKRTVRLDCGITLTVDLGKASTPAARYALYKSDRKGDGIALFDFLELALGEEQLDRLINALRHEDGEPGTEADLAKAVKQMFTELGPEGKKS